MVSSQKSILIYLPCTNEAEARKISRHLLEKRLIACANMFPISSIYRWKGKIREENEVVLLLKTLEEKYPVLQTEVEAIHSYKIPCISKIPVTFNVLYQRWVEDQVR